MAIDPDSFDEPVKDYVIGNTKSVNDLIEAMSSAGGFTATKLARAKELLELQFEKLEESNFEPEKCLNWISFPACLCATGTRGFFVEAIKQKKFNVISTTCGTLDHDIARTHKNYLHGEFELDDIELGEYGLNRLGNVIVPNSSYGEIIERVVLPALEEIRTERIEQTGLSGTELW